MIATLLMVVGAINIIAQNYNYNINVTRNPDFDIRVRRNAEGYGEGIILPEEEDIETNPVKNEPPLLIDLLKGIEEEYPPTKFKRDTYQYNKQTYNQINTNNGNYNNGNGNNGNANMGHFETKPDFITKTYNKVAQVFGYATRTTTVVPRLKTAYTKRAYSVKTSNGLANQNNGVYANGNQNNDRFYNPFNSTTFYNALPYGYSQNATANVTSFNNSSYYRNNNIPVMPYNNSFSVSNNSRTPLAPYNNPFNYNTTANSYSPIYYNVPTNATYNTFNGALPYNTNFSRNINNGTNGTPSLYNNQLYNNTYNPANNAQYNATYYRTNGTVPHNGNGNNDALKTTTTERIIAEGCIWCATFSCPEGQKRIGFKCAEINNYYDDYD